MRDILDSISAFILALWGLFLRVLFVCSIAIIIGLLIFLCFSVKIFKTM